MNKHFIKATDEYCTLEHHVPNPMFRRSFTLSKNPEAAEISICGLGFYMLYINGTDITKGHISPYISNPDHICYYDTYDITKLLTKGENVIGIILGNGFMNSLGGGVWDFDKALFRGAPRVAIDFSARVDGAEISFIADENFKTHPSPILFDDLRLGEIYDARCEIEGWTLPGFNSDNWNNAIVAEAPSGELRLCNVEPIRVIKEIKPIEITKEGNAYRYDFGINTAGITRLKISGEPGQKVKMWHGEALDHGKFYNSNIRFVNDFYDEYNQTDTYILSGKGEEIYSQHFRYNGFRYVLVEGITEQQATPELLTYLVMSSDLNSIGGFRCSNEKLNKLYSMVDNANRSNFYYFPTDCPHREKNGWTGDAAVSAEQMTLMYDTESSFREWLANIRKSQTDDGVIPCIIPTTGWGFHWGNGPTWDSALFILPYTLYKFRGSVSAIEENADAMEKYLHYIATRRTENGTVAYGLGDWNPVNRGSHDYTTPLALTDSIMVMHMAEIATEMFNAIGKSDAADYANTLYLDMRNTIRKELIDIPTLTTAGKTQTGQAAAIYYGVFNKNEIPGAVRVLTDIIHENRDSFDCGVIGLHCIFHVLSEYGEHELAYKMIAKDEFPSYVYLVNDGQTAIWEHFCNLSDPYDASYNHHYFGDVSRWLTMRLAGLEVVDYRTVKVAPRPVSQIDSAEAFYELPSGRVSVAWKREANGNISVSYSAPDGVKVIKAF